MNAMSRRILHRLSLLLVVAFAAAACEQHPTEAPFSTGEAGLAIYANVGEADLATLAVEVTAADISTPLVFNLEVEDGVASGSIRLPAGTDRLITVRGFSSTGEVTHHGEATVTVREGENPPLSITLVPLAGDQPIEVRFGTRVVVVHPGDVYLQVGDGYHMWAEVLNQNGEFITEEVRWASTNPARATVDENGYVQAKRTGAVEIVATYEGTAGSAQVHISGTDGQENNTSELIDFMFSPDEVDVTGSAAEVDVLVTLRDLDHGVQQVWIVVSNPNSTLFHDCSIGAPSEGDAHHGTWTCAIEIPADSEPGEWRIQHIGVDNYSGGWTSFNRDDVAAAGFPVGVAVISDDPDTEAPELVDFDFDLDTVHLADSDDYAQVRFDLSATDARTGVAEMEVEMVNVEMNYSTGCSVLVPDAGENVVEDFCTMWLHEWHPSGEWLATVHLTDHAGNRRTVSTEELDALGFPTVITLTRWDDE
jgi:hypothetical protein